MASYKAAMFLYLFLFQCLAVIGAKTETKKTLKTKVEPTGYLTFCPCMGRFGNQVDHYLGSIAFAKALGRTLILPPWVEYDYSKPHSIQVPFNKYFKVESVAEYLPVIPMEKFMTELAPKVWPKGNRTVLCYRSREGSKTCEAKVGNPFFSFWETFKIDFESDEFYEPLFYDSDPGIVGDWNKRFPVDKYPVLAFSGAPAVFPMREHDLWLQKYLVWSDEVEKKADEFISKNIGTGTPFIGIHMRNGEDYVRACEHLGGSNFFSSAQCLGYNNEHGKVTKELCLPGLQTVLKQLKKAVQTHDAKAVFVAVDDKAYLQEIRKELKNIVVVKQADPASPHVDLCILGKADHFIGNCVSSFSAFVKRERDVGKKTSEFWAFSPPKEEL